MPNTYELISAVTLTGTQGSISFSSIPGTYTDLNILLSARSNGTSFANPWQNLNLTLNSTSPTAGKQLFGIGGATGSDNATSGVWATNNNATASTFSNDSIYIPNYTSAVAKSVSADNVTENNGTDFAAVMWAALYGTVTSAVTSVTLTPVSGSFLIYTNAYLYGVKNA